MVTELGEKKPGKMESETVLCTYGRLPANQHGVVSLQVSINPAVQDDYDMALASFLEPYG